MIRMTLALSLAIYGGLVVWGDPVTEAATAVTPVDAGPAVAAAMASGPDHARPVILDGKGTSAPQVTRAAVSNLVVPPAATIAAAAPEPRPIGEPRLISLIATSDPAEAAQTEASATSVATGPLLRVSGSRVNMRAGPSTANRVLESLPAGTLAEPVGEPTGGWIEIRVVDTGVTGFMSARFLDPV